MSSFAADLVFASGLIARVRTHAGSNGKSKKQSLI